MKIVKLTLAATIMGIGFCSNANPIPYVNIHSDIYADNDKEVFRRKVNLKIDKIDYKLDRLKANFRRTGKKADTDYNVEVKRLKAYRDSLRSKLNDFKDDSKNNWEAFKRNIESETDNFQDEVDAFIKKRN